MVTPEVGRARSPVRWGALLSTTGVLLLGCVAAGQWGWSASRAQRLSWGGHFTRVMPWLWVLVVLCASACILTAWAVLRVHVRRDAVAPLGRRQLTAWWAVVLVGAAALVTNAVVLVAGAAGAYGPPIPIFHWAFTAVPAVAAGALVTGRGRRARVTAAAVTVVVTVPLLGLGWALALSGLDITTDPELYHPDAVRHFAAIVAFTVITGGLPLVMAVGVLSWVCSEVQRQQGHPSRT